MNTLNFSYFNSKTALITASSVSTLSVAALGLKPIFEIPGSKQAAPSVALLRQFLGWIAKTGLMETKMADQITPEYIDKHRHNVQTYESFGRNLADIILSKTKEHVTSHGAKPGVELESKISVKPTSIGCLDITVSVAGIPVVVHISV